MLRFCFKNMSRLKSKKGDSPTLKSLHLKKKTTLTKKKNKKTKRNVKKLQQKSPATPRKTRGSTSPTSLGDRPGAPAVSC